MKHHFSDVEPDGRGINCTRAYACEIVAWRFVSALTDLEALDVLLSDLPKPHSNPDEDGDVETGHVQDTSCQPGPYSEMTPLLEGQPPRPRLNLRTASRQGVTHHVGTEASQPTHAFGGLNALEIAVVVGAKKFVSQPPIQRIIGGIWRGDIVFWESLNVDCKKKPRLLNQKFVSAMLGLYGDRPYIRFSDRSGPQVGRSLLSLAGAQVSESV